MKKIIIFLFCLLVFINSTNAEVLIGKEEKTLPQSIPSNYQNDEVYSLKIFYTGNDENDFKCVKMEDFRFIDANKTITISYDNAIKSGGGSGGSIDYSGEDKHTVKTKLIITKKNGTVSESVYEDKVGTMNLLINKNDCYIFELWQCEERTSPNTNSKSKLFTLTLIGVNEIHTTENNHVIFDYNGLLYSYNGEFETGQTTKGRDYSLEIYGENLYARNSGEKNPEWYVIKGTKLTFDYKEGDYSIPQPYEAHKTVVSINDKVLAVNNLPKIAEEDMEIKLCTVSKGPNDFDYLYNKKETISEVKIKVDNTAPEIKFTKDIKNKEWISESIEVYAADDKTGIRLLEIKNENDPDCNKMSNDGSKLLIDNDGKYTISVTDGVGNQNVKTINMDLNPPEIEIKDNNNNKLVINEDVWFTAEKITINVIDEISGIKNIFVKDQTITSPYEISKNGIYTIKATDNAGNTTGTKTIKLDNKPPVITKKALSYTKNGGLIDTITVEASIEEDNTNSGLSEQVYIKNGDILAQSTITKINENNKTINAKIENINRSETNKYKLKVEAKDNAGNESIESYEDIVLPPKIQIEVESKKIEKTSDGKTNTVTKLNLKNYLENKSSYKNIKLQRFIYINTTRITEENFTNYFTEEARQDWRKITKIKEIKSDEIENGIYTDRISTDSGFGHKETRYIISWEIENIFDEDGNPIREESQEIKAITADNPGTVKIQIEGKDEKVEIDFATGKMTEGKKGIQLASDGSIKIWISIEDLDSEPYEVEVSQMIKVNGISEGLSYKKNGFIQSGISGKLQNETGKEIYEKGKWIAFPNPEYLSYNRETCLYLKIKEGFDEDKSVRESGKIYLKAEPLDLGGFTLKVCEKADYNSNGITAQPFQDVKLELNGEGQNAEWNFDDGITVNGITVEHKWNQKPERTGPISEYTLKITYMGKEATIPVHITDTKIGVLYGDEVWYGKHEVLGKIKIKEKQTLKIGSSEWGKDMEVLCIEDDNENFMGCFEVYGKLEINNGNGNVTITGGKNSENGIIKETEENTLNNLYWKGIEVNNGGQAVINHAEISGSRRGIAVDQGGIAVLSNCIFKQNGIGLHILGKSDSQNLTVINNDEYGIKEEYGCNYNIIKSTIKDNTINWYNAETGVLSIDEINEQLGE